MNHHYSDELIERYSLGRLKGDELAAFEIHLIICLDCRNAVSMMDNFLSTFRDTVKTGQPQERIEPRLAIVPPKVTRYYHLVRVESPTIQSQEVGVLLIDDKLDTLRQRFRRDWDQFAGSESRWLKHLPSDIHSMAERLGAQETLNWLLGVSDVVKVSSSKPLLAEDGFTTVDRLYAKHIYPNILRFVTHLPQYSLEAAAGKFGKRMESDPQGWVEVKTDRSLTNDMFVVHIKGQSMEPQIPDGSLGAFRSKIEGSLNGKVLLIEDYGESGGNRYTVKLCRLSPTADHNQPYDSVWLHPKMILESFNPAYEPLEIGANAKIRTIGEYLFVV